MNQKGLAAGIVVLFLVASSFIGLSNKTEHVTVGTNKLETPNEMSTYNYPIDSAWLTYSHDNRHTGQSSYSTRDNPMDVKWKFEAQFLGFESSPVIDKNGVLYILARDSNLYALNPDGSERWQYNINEWGSFSAAIAEDGTIYVGSHDGYLFAINSDGSLKWCFPIGDSIWGSPTIGNDGTIYVGSEFFGDSTDGYLYAFGAVDNNHPPEKPDINGPSTGKTREEQTYQLTTTDQDSDDVYVFVDWDDGSNSSWIGPVLSGEQKMLTHTWKLRGTYTIKSKAMDEHEVEGEWRNLSVILPYSHTNLLSQFFELLFQQFPNAFPLL